ncbi:MAG: hypothetical protein NC311_06520 [Muribaculaceae bacterium]|nr:hypothetical protein [Muribaculaceae bacterium]
MKEQRSFGLPILAFIAKKWLRGAGYEAKKEIIATKKFILKAERRLVPDTIKGVELVSTFSVHKKTGVNSWRYDKYLVDHDGSYSHLRSGMYPYDWE